MNNFEIHFYESNSEKFVFLYIYECMLLYEILKLQKIYYLKYLINHQEK